MYFRMKLKITKAMLIKRTWDDQFAGKIRNREF